MRRSVHRAIATTVAILAGVVLGGDSRHAEAQQEASLAFLRFVGASEANSSVDSVLTSDDVSLLVATREPAALNDIIASGIPVRSPRIEQLISWGLLRQVGFRFQSVVPILDVERKRRIAELLAPAVEAVTEDTIVALETVNDRVWRHPGVPSLPVITAWLFRERVWDQLTGPAALNFAAHIQEQRSHLPERGFWGLLWYEADPPRFPYGFNELHREDYTLQLAWNLDQPASLFPGAGGDGRAQQFLEKLERDGRRLDDPERFPDLIESGLVTADGDVRALAREYRMRDLEGLARITERAAADIAGSILSRTPIDALIAELGGASAETAYAIAYMHMVPRLVERLDEAELAVRAGDPDAAWREPGGELEEQSGSSQVRVRLEGGEDLPETAGWLPNYSAIIWKDLPRRTILGLPW